MKRYALHLLLLLPLAAGASEPSAFGAGDLNNPTPYGLTSSEKKILQNKETLKTIEQKTQAHQSEVSSLRERLDGLQTIIEGLNSKVHENSVEFGKFSEAYQSELNQSSSQSMELHEAVKANTQNVEQLKTVLGEFSKMIDDINANYVSKGEYNALVKDINDFKSLVSRELKASASGGTSLASMKKADVEKEAYALYKKKNYTKAIEYYQYLAQSGYRAAHSNYMIGEMWYYRGKYEKSISYFKESAAADEQASYMPVLLLHAAVAMDKTGDEQNANAFYSAIINKYPGTDYAAEARKRLK